MNDNTITLLGITGNVYVVLAVALLLLALWILWVVLPFIVYLIWRQIKETLYVNKMILLELSRMNGEISDFTSESKIKSDIDNPITQNKPVTQNCPECGRENSIEVMGCVYCGHPMPRIKY